MTHDTGPIDEFDSFACTILGEDTWLADLPSKRGAPEETGPSRQPAPRPARDVTLPSGKLEGITIAGRPPFVGGEPQVVMLAQARLAPPTLLAIRPDLKIPRDLQRVLDLALAKRPADRYDSARSLAAALAAI